MTTLAFFSSIIACLAFSSSFLFVLGIRIIRDGLDDRVGAFLAGVLVCFGMLAAVVTLEAAVLISVEREVAGRLFYAASVLGVVLLVLGSLGVITVPHAIEVALGQKLASRLGLALGNFLLLAINALSFAKLLPSVL